MHLQENFHIDHNKRSNQVLQLKDLSHGVPTLHLGEKVQLAKFGNSKIYVVKKKNVPLLQSENIASAQTLNTQQPNKISILNQNHSVNGKLLEEFQNTPLTHLGYDSTGSFLKGSKSLTPLRGSFSNNQSSQQDGSGYSPNKGTPSMINVNSSNCHTANPSFVNMTQQSSGQKHVNFHVNESQTNISQSNTSKERIEELRLQNSKREFQIRRPNKRSKERGLKSPSEFTTGAKSVISLFTSKSSKTNHSAPTGAGHSLSESPKRSLKLKKEVSLHKKNAKNIRMKKKLRPSSSVSGNELVQSSTQKRMNMTHTGFNQHALDSSQSKDRNSSQGPKKIIPIKQLKFPLKKQNTKDSGQGIPKPPLHKKQNNLFEEGHCNVHQNNQSNPEALLKMADESLANIDNELTHSRKGSKQSRGHTAEGSADSRLSNPPPPQADIKANFNFSINNSFNKSYDNQKQPSQVLAFSSSNKQQDNEYQYQGIFTADAVQLEKQLTNRLKEASGNEDKKLQAFNYTFNEVIKRDKNFGSLLFKIKQAYDEYLRKTLTSQVQSPVTTPSYEELLQKVQSQQIELQAQKTKNEEYQKQIGQMKTDLDEKTKYIGQLAQENDKLQGNFESFKMSKVMNSQDQSQNDTLNLLKLSNSSRSCAKQTKQNQQRISTNSLNSVHNKQQILQDLNVLVSQNIELTQACGQYQSEVTYLRLREKKIMYLVYMLQSKGYPVNDVFEKDVKPIPTMRFQEFLDNHPDLEEQLHVETEDDKNLISFHSDDSYEPFTTEKPKKQRKPSCVPPLNFGQLPQYETSSSEEGDQDVAEQMNKMNPQQYYQESLKYIENFYNKYATQPAPGSAMGKISQLAASVSQSLEGVSVNQPLSQEDMLSRDMEDDIKEEILL